MTTISKALAHELCDIAASSDEYRRYPTDSGRFMFGSTCLGVEASRPLDLSGLMSEIVSRSARRELSNMMKSARWDNLGLEYITYFPGFLWPEGVDVPDRELSFE